METMLCENLKKVEDNVDAACREAGRALIFNLETISGFTT